MHLKTKLFIIILFAIILKSGHCQNKMVNDSLLTISVNEFVNNWHMNATEADEAYFEKIDDNGIYIGTDATELWTKDEFYTWSKKYFDNGKAWSFTTLERNVYFSNDGLFVWFDELLDTGMGNCRASGVLIRKANSWKIKHYHLSITIPNESVEQVKKIITSR